jgi:hypothetical protein
VRLVQCVEHNKANCCERRMACFACFHLSPFPFFFTYLVKRGLATVTPAIRERYHDSGTECLLYSTS